MKTLADILGAPHQRDAVVADLVKLIEHHIAGRGGLKGMTLKTGLAMMKAAKPDILPRATSRLLPEFAASLEPLYQEFRKSPDRDFSLFLQKQAARTADALLATADARVAASSNKTVKNNYARLRGTAETEVLAAVPAISRLLRGYLD